MSTNLRELAQTVLDAVGAGTGRRERASKETIFGRLDAARVFLAGAADGQ